LRRRSYQTTGFKRGPGDAEAIRGAEPCAIPPCPGRATENLQLRVDGVDSVLLVCQTHADWLCRYIEEDADVTIVGRMPPGHAAGSTST
jgi:hypothetical protein